MGEFLNFRKAKCGRRFGFVTTQNLHNVAAVQQVLTLDAASVRVDNILNTDRPIERRYVLFEERVAGSTFIRLTLVLIGESSAFVGLPGRNLRMPLEQLESLAVYLSDNRIDTFPNSAVCGEVDYHSFLFRHLAPIRKV
jgi:hypothetical protein